MMQAAPVRKLALASVALAALVCTPVEAQGPQRHHLSVPARDFGDGTWVIPMTVNMTLTHCTVDSGAYITVIPQAVFDAAMADGGHAIDFGTADITLADGSQAHYPKYALDGLRLVGRDMTGVVMQHVGVVVIPDKARAGCLIGQSMLSRFWSVRFDYEHSSLEVTW